MAAPILIAGTGHARTDRGVPWYHPRARAGKEGRIVMFIEVEDGNTDRQSYVPLDPDGGPAADFVIFTPRAERGDPCEKDAQEIGSTARPAYGERDQINLAEL